LRFTDKHEEIGGYILIIMGLRPNYYGFAAYQVGNWLDFLSLQLFSCRFEDVSYPKPRGNYLDKKSPYIRIVHLIGYENWIELRLKERVSND
jgi:hypothetical protein